MEELTKYVQELLSKGRTFIPKPLYNEMTDEISFFFKDEDYRQVKVNENLDLFMSCESTPTIIGFKLKNVAKTIESKFKYNIPYYSERLGVLEYIGKGQNDTPIFQNYKGKMIKPEIEGLDNLENIKPINLEQFKEFIQKECNLALSKEFLD